MNGAHLIFRFEASVFECLNCHSRSEYTGTPFLWLQFVAAFKRWAAGHRLCRPAPEDEEVTK